MVLLEDTGALAGLAFAVVGLGARGRRPANRASTPSARSRSALLLGVIAVVLAVEMKSLLIGESAGTSTRAALDAALRDAPEVRSVIHVRTLQLGPEELLVAAKLDFRAPTTAELAPAIDAVEARIRAAVPEARLIFLEPDLDRTRAAHTSRVRAWLTRSSLWFDASRTSRASATVSERRSSRTRTGRSRRSSRRGRDPDTLPTTRGPSSSSTTTIAYGSSLGERRVGRRGG